MVTQAKNGIFKPKVFIASLLPSSAKKAFQYDKWLHAMQEEHSTLLKNIT